MNSPVSEIEQMESATAGPQAASRPEATGPAADLEETIIRPRPGWIAVDWIELWRYRELLYFLVWRDVKVRYKQTVLGASWAVLQPVVQMVLFTVILFGVAGMGTHLPEGLPAAVWMFAGLVPWMLFQTGMADGGMALVNQQQLLKKIYLPRLFVPAAPVGRGFVDMALAWVVFAALMAYYQPAVSWTIIFLPVMMLLTVIASLGIAYTLSALSVTYRDFRFIIPFMAQIWMWLSFIQLPLEALRDSERLKALGLAEHLDLIASINPMVGIIQGYRSAIFADIPWSFGGLLVSTLAAAGMFLFGVFYFRKTERRFADIA